MKAGSMIGLIGASQNMKIADTPMKIYREAERKGDNAAMEHAMKYVSDFTEKAYEYSEKAQGELIKERKEEREELESKKNEQLEERREDKNKVRAVNEGVEVEISEAGQKLNQENYEEKSGNSNY